MESNLPAIGSETGLVEAADAARPAVEAQRPISRPLSVAFLPLALTVFVIVAFAVAAWTFLAAGG
jgi:hypothetical protein